MIKILLNKCIIILAVFTFFNSCDFKLDVADSSDNLNSAMSTRNSIGNSVKVFILAGQSNMEGQGIVEPEQKHIDKNGGEGTLRYLVTDSDDKSKYSHLINSSGNWSSRSDVWLVELTKSGPLTVQGRRLIGPETQFGHIVGDYYKNSQVLIIKTAWGGKSLYVDFRPPSSGGTVGPYYEEMIKRAHEVLDNITNFYPDYNGQGYEIVGFGWHQGWNDRVNDAAVAEYQQNCVNLINDLRAEFELPEMPFVLATTGMTGWSETGVRALALMNAQLAVPNDSRLTVKINVKAVETRGFWRDESVSPSGFGFHWNMNAESYFLIGDGMGNAMTKFLQGDENVPPTVTTVVYEAENYSRKNGCLIKSDYSGFTGSGYIYFGGMDSWIQWNRARANADGTFKLVFRYANGGSKCPSTVTVNDTYAGKVIFRNTGGWGNWKTVSTTVTLKNGTNKIRVTSATANGVPNLDHMEISGIVSSD